MQLMMLHPLPHGTGLSATLLAQIALGAALTKGELGRIAQARLGTRMAQHEHPTRLPPNRGQIRRRGLGAAAVCRHSGSTACQPLEPLTAVTHEVQRVHGFTPD
jgi:hypothetical protein